MPLADHPCPFCERRSRNEWNLVRHVWKEHTSRRGGPGKSNGGNRALHRRVIWDTVAGDRFLLECVGWKGHLPDMIDCWCDTRFTNINSVTAIDQWLEHLEDAGGMMAHILYLCLHGPTVGGGMESRMDGLV